MVKSIEKIVNTVKRKTLQLILASSLVLPFFGCTKKPTYNTKDFVVSYPPGWTTVKYGASLNMGSGNGVSLYSPNDKEKIGVLSRELKHGETLESFIEKIKKRMYKDEYPYQKIDTSQIKLSGQDGYQIEYIYRKKVGGRWCYAVKDDKIYTIFYVDKIDNFNDNLHIMDEIKKSFKIK